jgi:hypothetical protein
VDPDHYCREFFGEIIFGEKKAGKRTVPCGGAVLLIY